MPSDDPTPTVFSQDHKGPPILTAGTLTPGLLCAFHMGALEFFSLKNIPADKHVLSVVWGLHDPHIQN